MARPIVVAVALALLTAMPAAADDGQSRGGARGELFVNGAGLVSIATTDDGFVGSPYLEERLGGTAAGFSIGLGYRRGPFTALGEFSSAFLTKTLVGRNVNGGDTSEGEGRRPDSLLSGLVGVSFGGRSRLDVYGGVSAQVGRPTLDGVSVSEPGGGTMDPADSGGASYFAVTTGVDVTRRLSERWSLLGTFRYSYVPASMRSVELGVGENLVRFGAGVRLRLSD